MSTDFMITNPNSKFWKNRFWKMVDDLDIHKWVIGFEVGKNGYRHLQARVRVSKDEKEGFTAIKQYLPLAHTERCSDTWTYERKTGRFLSSEDTPEIRETRFRPLKPWQYNYLMMVDTANDRQIDVLVNEEGGIGKSWFTNALWERAQAHYIPPHMSTIEKIVSSVASVYSTQGYRPYLIIDIPRAYKWSEQLYVAIESIKDGLVVDPRYQNNTVNIRGVKIIVMCNTAPDVRKLSADRWRITEMTRESALAFS